MGSTENQAPGAAIPLPRLCRGLRREASPLVVNPFPLAPCTGGSPVHGRNVLFEISLPAGFPPSQAAPGGQAAMTPAMNRYMVPDSLGGGVHRKEGQCHPLPRRRTVHLFVASSTKRPLMPCRQLATTTVRYIVVAIRAAVLAGA